MNRNEKGKRVRRKLRRQYDNDTTPPRLPRTVTRQNGRYMYTNGNEEKKPRVEGSMKAKEAKVAHERCMCIIP